MTTPLGGADIAEIMSSVGPIVKCVILRCQKPGSATRSTVSSDSATQNTSSNDATLINNSKPAAKADRGGDNQEYEDDRPPRLVLKDWIDQMEIDTTPSKSMVAKTLGGGFTFLGQYEDEGIVLMVRNLPEDLEVEVMEREEAVRDEIADDDDGKGPTTERLTEQLSRNFKVSELKAFCREREIPTDDMLEKADVIRALIQYQQDLPPYNPHQLQPPLHTARARGDILILRVAETEEELDNEEEDDDGEEEAGRDGGDGGKEEEKDGVILCVPVESTENDEADEKAEDNGNEACSDSDAEPDTNDAKEVSVPSNEEFFLDYTKDEYLKFASRTDIPEHDLQFEEADGEDEGPAYIIGEDGEEIGEEDKSAMFNLVMNEVLRQYRKENGRGPNTQELLDMRANIAKELDVQVADEMDGNWDKKAKEEASHSGKKIAFLTHDKVKEYVPDEDEYSYDVDPDGTVPVHEDEDEDDDDDDDYFEPPSKRVKTSRNDEDVEEEDSKPAAIGPPAKKATSNAEMGDHGSDNEEGAAEKS